MRLSLSTNWCNRRLESGEAIADTALELGFDELELGYHTTAEQAEGFRRRLDAIRVGSVHAFCPVPISAPCGHPELYPLASLDEESAKMALLQVRRNVSFAAEIGADTLVLHAGRVACGSPFARVRTWLRERRGRKTLEAFRRMLERIVPELVCNQVTLALENLPYYEGFPDDGELKTVLDWGYGDWVKGWYDTGHARVGECSGWRVPGLPDAENYAGMHLNDVTDKTDDHFAPSFGKVDFPSLKDFAHKVRHVVFEPSSQVSPEDLATGLGYIRSIWS